ncbi:MAG: hypothetical protein ABSG15_06935 [FCB group bacterium]|jgi:tetratricopeptide (TPR) repeat protein
MKIKNILTDNKTTKIFNIINDDDDDNPLNWQIETTDLELIPYIEGHFIVKALEVYADKTVDCYINMVTPERISDYIFKIENENIICSPFYKQNHSIISAVPSDCFGNYDLYYAKENPQIGIDILKEGLSKAKNKSFIAEELGYILSDENRITEAIEAFLISENNNPSSEGIYCELADLYKQLGNFEKQKYYLDKFETLNEISIKRNKKLYKKGIFKRFIKFLSS